MPPHPRPFWVPPARAAPPTAERHVPQLMSAPMPIADFFWIDAVLFDVATEIDEDVFIMMNQFAGANCYTRVTHSSHANGLHDKMVAVGAVPHVHVKRRRGRALLLIAINLEALRVNMIATEQQLLNSGGITMEVDDHGAIGSKQRLKHLIIQSMWVSSLFLQYE